MANPTPYTKAFNFAGYQAMNPVLPAPGSRLDTEFSNVAASIASLRSSVMDVRREDGKLVNGLVGYDALDTPLKAMLGTAPSELDTITDYIDEIAPGAIYDRTRRDFLDRAAAIAGGVDTAIKEIYVQRYDAAVNAGAARYREAANDTEYTGTPARAKMTVSSRKWVLNEPEIDVTMLGAHPSASAAVNSEAIQQAILAGVYLGSKVVVAHAGTYLCSAQIYGTALNNLDFEVRAGAVVKATAALVDAMFDLRGDNMYIHGFGTLDNQDTPTSTPGSANDTFDAIGNRITVRDLTFVSGDDWTTSTADSHLFLAGNDLLVENTFHYGARDLGIYFTERGATGGTERRAKVVGSKFFSCASGVSAKRGLEHFHVESCYFENGNFGVYPGDVDDGSAPGTTAKYFTCIDNTFVGYTNHSILIRVTDGFDVRGNKCINSTAQDIVSVQGSKRGQIKNNLIRIDPTVYTSPSTQRGIVLRERVHSDTLTYHSTDNTIQDNVIEGVYTPILEFDANQDFNVYENNRCFGYTVTGPTGVQRSAPNSIVRNISQGGLIAQTGATGFDNAYVRDATVNYRRSAATFGNAYSITLPEGYSTTIEVMVSANRAGTKGGGGRLIGIFKRAVAGNVTAVGSLITDMDFTDFSTASATIVAETPATIRIQARGDSGLDTDFNFYIRWLFIKDNT